MEWYRPTPAIFTCRQRVNLSGRISDILCAIVTLDGQEPKTGTRKHLASVMDFARGSGSLLLNVRKRMGPNGIGKIPTARVQSVTHAIAPTLSPVANAPMRSSRLARNQD
jgi:hypothetical protein